MKISSKRKYKSVRFYKSYLKHHLQSRTKAWKIIILRKYLAWIQWGSEYQTSSVFEWLKKGLLTNGPEFKCHLNTGRLDHLNTRQMNAILFSYALVWYLNIKSSTQDKKHGLTIWNMNFKKLNIQMFAVFKSQLY